jgi:NADP-dependent 3-hydroxy acid dehydrogenase YdfG
VKDGPAQRLDIVFANAGVAKFAPLGTITEEFYDSIFDVNVKACSSPCRRRRRSCRRAARSS